MIVVIRLKLVITLILNFQRCTSMLAYLSLMLLLTALKLNPYSDRSNAAFSDIGKDVIENHIIITTNVWLRGYTACYYCTPSSCLRTYCNLCLWFLAPPSVLQLFYFYDHSTFVHSITIVLSCCDDFLALSFYSVNVDTLLRNICTHYYHIVWCKLPVIQNKLVLQTHTSKNCFKLFFSNIDDAWNRKLL